MTYKRKRSDDMQFFDFEYNGSDNHDASIKQLDELLQPQQQHHSDCKTLRNFVIQEPNWTESLLTRFVNVFRQFAERGQLWDSLEIIPREGYLSSTSHYYLRPLLFAANTMNLFREIVVSAPLIPGGGGDHGAGEDGMVVEHTTSILAGALLNTRLESLSISCPLEIMAHGDFQALLQLVGTTRTLNELTLNGLAIRSDKVAKALAKNKTLRKVSLNVTANDMGLSSLIQALHESTKLEELLIQTDNQFGPLCSKALQTLLLRSKTLKSLTLQDNSPFCQTEASRKLHLSHLLDGLKGSRSIEYLSMKNLFLEEDEEDSMILSKMFPVLNNSSNSLKGLELLTRTRITQQDLEQVTNMPRLQKPLRLNLDRRLLLDHTTAFFDMLQAHPEIRRPWPRNVVAETIEGFHLQHVWELNYHGRALLLPQLNRHDDDNCSSIPLSLWPTVLEKANDKSNVLFTFLKGPAFAGSQNCQ
ncbi:unnamed protein product [Cylindrotheca closterium]|uniref:Uncharacterized protein n=1 Tax=Cylindrotheca closterium TaxID=2856 RepID=A0AAD2G5J9_9STRA|nr:unnamed protein product [Cylindrotheca closterium]